MRRASIWPDLISSLWSEVGFRCWVQNSLCRVCAADSAESRPTLGRRTERTGGPLNMWNKGYQATCRRSNLAPLSAPSVGLSPADQRWFVTPVLFNMKSEKNQATGPSLWSWFSLQHSPRSLNSSLVCFNKPLCYLASGPVVFLTASFLADHHKHDNFPSRFDHVMDNWPSCSHSRIPVCESVVTSDHQS